MTYYYFTLAFVLLASFAVCSLSGSYSPDLIFKKSITVKNEALRRLLKIEARDTDGKADECLDKVTLVGIILKLLWLILTVVSFIILFAIEAAPITEEHSAALIMPIALTTFNQKTAHYINLVFLLFSSALCIFNFCKVLCKPEDGANKKAVFAIRTIWCAVAVGFICFGVYVSIKCIQLFAYM